MRQQCAAIPHHHTHTDPNTKTEYHPMTTPQRRDHAMPLGGTDDLMRDYAYMCDDSLADRTLCDAAAAAIDRHDVAVKMAAKYRTDHIDALGNLRRVEQAADAELWQAFAAGKRPPIDALVTRLAKMSDDTQRAHKQYQYAERIENQARSDVGAVIHTHKREVIAWVAAHRARNDDIATQCGEVLPLPVLRMWYRLSVLFDQPAPYGLDLAMYEHNGRLNRLPVEWYQTWPTTVRASLAWWWRQIADGRYIITNRGRLAITAAVIGDLPRVPPQHIDPTTPRR